MRVVWTDGSRAVRGGSFSQCDIFRTVRTYSPDCRASCVRNGHLGVKHIAIRIKEKKTVQVICYSLLNKSETMTTLRAITERAGRRCWTEMPV